MTQQPITMSNYKSAWLQQSGNLLAADIFSSVVEAGVIANIDSFDKKFPTISSAVQGVLSVPLYYLQRPIEKVLSYTKNIEGDDYYRRRMSHSDDERLASITKAAYHYGAALSVGWGGMVASSKVISNLTHTPPIHGNMFMKDMLIHAGLITAMSLPQMANTTQRMKDMVKCVAKGFGADEDKAEDLGRIAIFSGVPNYATFSMVSGLMYRDNKMKALQHALEAGAAKIVP